MNKQPIEQAQDADLRLSVAAMQLAARRARELARRTGTYLVVSQDGEVIYLHPDQMDPRTPATSPDDRFVAEQFTREDVAWGLKGDD
jgi:hypothetical protein